MKPAFCVLVVCKYAAGSGPVYVNPEAAQSSSVAPSAAVVSGGDLVTQTVYGFLDFTTTIGNTVMIFSPQSAPAAPGTLFSIYTDLVRDFFLIMLAGWLHALKRTRNDFLSFHFALCSFAVAWMRALWKYSTAALNFSRSVFFLSFFRSWRNIYMISFLLSARAHSNSDWVRRALPFHYKMSFSSELHFQMNNGAKRKSAFIIKKEEIHSGYAAMQEKLCEAPKAIQSAHTMGEIILSLELHSTYIHIHSRSFECTYIFLSVLIILLLFILSVPISPRE